MIEGSGDDVKIVCDRCGAESSPQSGPRVAIEEALLAGWSMSYDDHCPDCVALGAPFGASS